MKEKYKKTMVSLVAGFVVIFAYYLRLVTVTTGPKTFATMIVFPAILLVYVFATFQVHSSYIKKGYYSDNQALKFYNACNEKGIGRPHNNTFHECEELYLMVFGTYDYEGKNSKLSHMISLYYAGEKISKDKTEKEGKK